MADTSEQTGISTTRRIVEIVVGLIVLGLFAWAYTSVLRAFHGESEKRFDVIVDSKDLGKNYVDGKLTVTGVDPVKGEITARIELDCQGDLLGEDEFTLAHDLTINVNSVKGKQMETFKKGSRLPALDVTLALYDGEALEYPYDKHKAELYMDISYIKKAHGSAATPPAETKAPEGDAKPPEGEAKAPEADAKPPEGEAKPEGPEPEGAKQQGLEPQEEDEEIFVPVAMQFEASAPGFRFDVSESSDAKDKKTKGFESADLEIQRSPTVKGFSIFIMTLIWCIALTILVMTLAVWLRGRKLEFGMMTFIAAMLFAFPAIRNLQPGVPPIGAWPDFVAVFWAQGITGLCLVIMLGVWLARPVKG